MEMHRKQNIVRNQILKGPEIERKIQLVQKEIRNEGSIIKKLCSDLEDPKNYNRWKEPEGEWMWHSPRHAFQTGRRG